MRTALDIEMIPYGIPGARWIPPESLNDPHQLIHKDSEVIFYCAEPREATSARMALLLDSHGYKNVHPLSGGLEGWRQAGFDVESLHVEGAHSMAEDDADPGHRFGLEESLGADEGSVKATANTV